MIEYDIAMTNKYCIMCLTAHNKKIVSICFKVE